MTRLLVVDDDARALQAMGAVLSRYETVCLGSSPDALAAVAAGGRFDAAVFDYRMPVLDGFQLQDAVAVHDPVLATRVVFVTGSPEIFRLATQRGVLVPKPFTAQQLLRAVAQALDAPASSSVVEAESVEDPDTAPTWNDT